MTFPRFVPGASLVGLALATLATSALAQTAPAPGNMPRPACTKPGEFPGRLASDRQLRAWQNDLKAYGECVKKFTEDQKAVAELAIKAANAAADEYNAMVKAASDEMK